MDALEAFPKTLAAEGAPSEYLRSIFDREMRATVNNVELGSPRDTAMKNLVDEAANVYADRVVRELLQNAYDGASETLDRRILLRLDLRVGPGVLYVANSGHGFAKRNVDAIVSPAMSDKTPGNFIGHKGLGFRSVELLTDDVQVFSMSGSGRPGAERFDGYRFRFRRPDDEREWLRREGKEDLAGQVVGLIHHLQLPVALDAEDEEADRYASEGYATLIRLPLRDADAAAKVEAELRSFIDGDAPIILFLDQLESLRIEVLRDGRQKQVGVLKRVSKPSQIALPDRLGQVEHVQVDDARFLVGRMAVDLSRFRASVAESAQRNQALSRWLEWKQAPVVSVALPDTADARPGCFYAFLPMDQAIAPFNGFLDAPFYPKLDRRALDLNVPMNAFLLEACADLCLAMSGAIAARNSREINLRRAAVDAVAWARSTGPMLSACTRAGTTSGAVRLPSMVRADDGGRWAQAADMCHWDDSAFKVLKHRRIVKACGARVLPGDLGKERTRSLVAFLEQAEVKIEADVARWAAWLPDVAKDLARPKKFNRAEWEGFYKDLAHVPGLLSQLGGKAIFPTGEGKLVAGNTFAGPEELFVDSAALAKTSKRRRFAGTSLKPPESIAKRMAFVDERIVWETPTLKAYVQAKLLAEYNLARVLTTAKRLLPKKPPKPSLRALLGWAFAAWRSDKSVEMENAVKAADLLLPTQAGAFKAARETIFGHGWSETRGDLTATFLREASEARSLRSMRDGLLVEWENWPLRDRGSMSEWTQFLRLLGVGDGLKVYTFGALKLDYGQWVNLLQPDDTLRPFERSTGRWWRERMRHARATERFAYKSKDWDTGASLYFIPGQGDYENMSDTARLAYAKLIAAALPIIKSFRETTLTKVGGNAAVAKFPSPIACFLEDAPWLPVGSAENPDWKHIRDCWISTRQEPLPSFVPKIERGVREMLDTSETRRVLAEQFGLRQWHEKASAVSRIQELGRLLSASSIAEGELDAFRGAYAKAWNDWRGLEPRPTLPQGLRLAVQSGGRLAAVQVAKGTPHPSIFLCDGSDPTRDQMLELLGHNVLHLPTDVVAPAAEALSNVIGGTFRATSDAQVSIKLDDKPLDPRAAPNLVSKGQEWIAEYAVLIQEFNAKPGDLPSARSRQAVYEEVMRLRLAFAGKIAVEVDGIEGTFSDSSASVLAAPDAEFPAIVMLGPRQEASWTILSEASRVMAPALGRPGLRDAFRLAFVELETARRGMPFERPDDASLAKALGRPASRVQEILRALRGSNRRLLTILVPIAQALLGGSVGQTLVDRGEGFSEEAEFAKALLAAGATPESAARIVATSIEAEDLDHARRMLEIALPRFNEGIAVLGYPWVPLRFEARLRRTFEKWLGAERGRLERKVRDSYMDVFEGGDSLTEYTTSSRLDWITFDPSWIDELDDLPAETIEGRFKLLAAEKLPRAAAAPGDSPDAVRENNRRLLVALFDKIWRLLGAWKAAAPGRTVPREWALGSEEVIRTAMASGAFEFQLLVETTLPRELARAGLWPEGLAFSLDAAAHGLGEAEMQLLDQARAEAVQSLLVERRSLSFGSVTIDGGADTALQEVAIALSDLVNSVAFRKRCGEANLATFAIRAGAISAGSGGGRSVRTTAVEYMSAEQRNLTGFAGEFAAYIHLRRTIKNFRDNFWVSSLGQRYLGLGLGNDAAGCDFYVTRSRGPDLLYEVKSSSGDPGFIDLEPSQVEKAAAVADGHEAIWRCLYVTYARDTARTAVQILPNPFSDDGRRVLRPTGRQTMRFDFSRI